uniref:hypothetical protein n=1 Tax=Amycolatopsis sp. CA-096443 TaxID=3239919 RepID=UPI003F498CC1
MAATTATTDAGRAHSDEAHVLDVPAPTRHRQTMATASNYHEYEIDPGRYPVRMTNIDGTPWQPDPNTLTPGFIANTGPYYAEIEVTATHTRSYYVNRLLTASSVSDTPLNEPTTLTVSVYAYLVQDGAPGPFAGSVFRRQAHA